jgi:hypothetical protein
MHSYQRNRSGMSRWAPTSGMMETYSDPATVGRIRWTFRWDDPVRMYETGGRHRALELEANVSQRWASEYFPEGYFTSNNFPVASRPYQDVAFGDSGATKSFGYGAADAYYFQPYVSYSAAVGVNHTDINSDVHPVEVRVVAATAEDHTLQAGNRQYLAFCVSGTGRCGRSTTAARTPRSRATTP